MRRFELKHPPAELQQPAISQSIACRVLIICLTLGIVYLLGACSQTDAPAEAPRIGDFYLAQSDSAYSEFIANHHRAARSQLKDELDSYLDILGGETVGAADSVAERLAWLINGYTTATDVADIGRRFDLYQSWDTTIVAEKLILDSIFAASDSVYRSHSGRDSDSISRHYRRQLVDLARGYGAIRDSFHLAAAESYLANFCYDRGEVDSAMHHADRCRAICRELDACELLGDCELLRYNIFTTHYADYVNAEVAAMEALRSFRRADAAGRIPYALIRRAFSLHQLAQPDGAIDMFRQALDGSRELGNVDLESYCLNMLAEAFYDLEEYDSAYYYADNARNIRRRLADSRPGKRQLVNLAHSESTLGLILGAEGNGRSATHMFTAAEDNFISAGDTIGMCLNLGRRAWLAVDGGEYDRAGDLFKKVVEISEKYETRIEAVFGLAVCKYYQRRIHQSLDLLHSCIRQLETARGRLPSAEMRAGMLADKVGFFDMLATIFLEQYLDRRQAGFIDSTLYYLERRNARTLSEQLDGQDNRQNELDDSLVDAISRLHSRLVLKTGDSSTTLSHLQALEDSLHAHRMRDPSAAPTYPGPTTGSAPTIAAIRKYLGETTALVQYVVTGFGSFAITVTPDTARVVEFESAYDSLKTLVARHMAAISSSPTSSEGMHTYRSTGAELNRILLTGILADADSIQNLLIIPSGPLHRLPFGSLVDSEGVFAAERYEISYIPSLTVLQRVLNRKTSADNQNIAAFGDPRLPATSGFVPLNHSAEEVEALGRVFPTGQVQPYLGGEATVNNFKRLDFNRLHAVHLATHGYGDRRDPDRSAILFSSDSTAEISSCLLHADEIRRMDMPLALAFLSSCGSGIGRRFAGEGTLSLARPFLIAGCREVIVTYWNIDDRATASFVKDFYSILRDEGSSVRALTTAKRRFIRGNRPLYRHPYFWAPYVLVGPGGADRTIGDNEN